MSHQEVGEWIQGLLLFSLSWLLCVVGTSAFRPSDCQQHHQLTLFLASSGWLQAKYVRKLSSTVHSRCLPAGRRRRPSPMAGRILKVVLVLTIVSVQQVVRLLLEEEGAGEGVPLSLEGAEAQGLPPLLVEGAWQGIPLVPVEGAERLKEESASSCTWLLC